MFAIFEWSMSSFDGILVWVFECFKQRLVVQVILCIVRFVAFIVRPQQMHAFLMITLVLGFGAFHSIGLGVGMGIIEAV